MHESSMLGNKTIQSAIAMVGASVFFIFNDASTKVLSQELPLGQVLFLRGFVAVLAAFLFLRAQKISFTHKDLLQPTITLRFLMEAGISLTYVYALKNIPLTTGTAIMLTSPLLITGLSVIFLKELVGWRRWSAAFFGFAGALLVIQPGLSEPVESFESEAYFYGILSALLAVVFASSRDMITRKIGTSISSSLVMFSTSLAGFMVGVFLSFAEEWVPLTFQQILLCVFAALMLNIGNILLIVSCRFAEASLTVPFRYTGLLASVLMDMFFFGTIPNAIAFAGVFFIIASGAYTVYREQVRREEDRLL